ncbi:MAG TPA: RteC domain-containing protein [Flavobacterium sp.]|uniref:RteC domain-containing protein n=1 Tax=Flavobacterium sp. TaxID=239 RepID=UPI002DBFFC9C|nr:RteC domain-containing protein [Flavobacterium sp.]HEU4789802.1 RteC domain-containing protein [Flavobacterium sp.]
MNSNYPIETRYSTLKKYQDNYENDLKIFLENHEDNIEIDFLEIDLFSHKNLLDHFLTKLPDYISIDDGTINQRNINSQRRIIAFIENKIALTNNQELTIVIPKVENTLKWQGTPLQFAELTKALILSGKLNPELSQKEVFKRMKQLFNVEDFNENDKLKDIRKKSKELTPLINTLEISLTNWIKNKD